MSDDVLQRIYKHEKIPTTGGYILRGIVEDIYIDIDIDIHSLEMSLSEYPSSKVLLTERQESRWKQGRG